MAKVCHLKMLQIYLPDSTKLFTKSWNGLKNIPISRQMSLTSHINFAQLHISEGVINYSVLAWFYDALIFCQILYYTYKLLKKKSCDKLLQLNWQNPLQCNHIPYYIIDIKYDWLSENPPLTHI